MLESTAGDIGCANFCCFIQLIRILQWLRNCTVFNISFGCFMLDAVSSGSAFRPPTLTWLPKITEDLESPAPFSYISFRRFRVIRSFLYNGISYIGATNIGGFAPKIPLNGHVSTTPPKSTSLHNNTCFGTISAAIWRAVRPVRVEKKIRSKF